MVLPVMQKRNKGTIIFTTSKSTNAGIPWPTKKDSSKESVTRFAEALQTELNNEQKEGGFKENAIEVYSLLTGEGYPDDALDSTDMIDTESVDEIEVMKTSRGRKEQPVEELPIWALVFLASGKAQVLKGCHVNNTGNMAASIAAA